MPRGLAGTLSRMPLGPFKWENDSLMLLDQRLLPTRVEWIRLHSAKEVAEAIASMAVRGAPAIGVAAAYGMALAALKQEDLGEANRILAGSRPTAVNLFWALERIAKLADRSFEGILAEARTIEGEDVASNRAIGEHGSILVADGARVLTICNTGSLATAGHGTALGIVRTVLEQGKRVFVWSCETRPRLQGLKLTAWELAQDGIPFMAIADSTAGALMRAGRVDCVIAGADRIASNGDTANKIGTYMLAVLSAHHGVPFYVAAPCSTIDPSLASGDLIPIEERDDAELTEFDGRRVAPAQCPVYNPAFDVTPGSLITAIVTDRGVHGPPYRFGPGLAGKANPSDEPRPSTV